MALYVLGEGKISVSLSYDHIDKTYRIVLGKHDMEPGKVGSVIPVNIVPIRDPVVFETKDRDQALAIATGLVPSGYDRFVANLE